MNVKNKSLTLAEILISVVILSIVAAGIFASFIAAKRFTNRAKRRMAAVNLARHISEDLYQYVRADTWTTNLLSCASYPCTKQTPADFSLPTIEADNPLFNYSVTAFLDIDLDSPTNPPPANCDETCGRQVTIRVEWVE